MQSMTNKLHEAWKANLIFRNRRYCQLHRQEPKRTCEQCNAEKPRSSFRRRPAGEYHELCEECENRGLRVCKVCGELKPKDQVSGQGTCDACFMQKTSVCTLCGKEKTYRFFELGARPQRQPHAHCKACEAKRKCTRCLKYRMADGFESERHLICKQCKEEQHPACVNCGTVAKGPVPEQDRPAGVWYHVF